MEVVCSKCNSVYDIPEKKIPTQNAVMTCKRCQHRIPVKAISQSAPPIQMSSDSRTETATIHKNAPLLSHPSEIVECFPQATEFNPVHYQLAQILTPTKKGSYKTSRNKLKFKILRAAKPVLDRLLEKEEKVVHICFGTAYYPLEMFLGNGVLTTLYNRYVIAATEKRLVAINTNSGMKKATHYIFQFPYSNIKKVSRGLFGSSLVLIRKQGKKRIFNGIKSGLAGEMKQWLETKIDPNSPVAAESDYHDNLCPKCYQPQASNLTMCAACGADFKSPRKSALRSLVLPGLGDIYLGHRFLGGFELIGSFIIWITALGFFFSGRSEDIIFGFFLLLIFNGMDALLTLHMAKKGYALEKEHG